MAALIAWEPISSRIALARFKGRPINITVIAVYAPTLPSDEATKDEFYDCLQNVVNSVPRGDMLVVAGDWNARTGPADNSTRHVLGRFGLGQRCGNGDRLVNFAALNRMCISSTRFQHPRRHLLTWYSNDGRTAHQLDHILIRSRWASSIEDCRAYRGAEAGNKSGSDHVLLRAKMKLHLANRRRRAAPKRLNITLLNDAGCQNGLCNDIRVKLESEAVVEEQSDPVPVEVQWRKIKQVILQAASVRLGTVHYRKHDWISAQTLQLSALAKEARLSHSNSYKHLRREATRSARADRNQYWSTVATDMETAANTGNVGRLFRLLRLASQRNYSQQTILRSSSGQPIRDLNGKLTRWLEHFSQLHEQPGTRPPITPIAQSTTYNTSCCEPTRQEILKIITQLKNNKAPGEDGIPAEVYKTCSTSLLNPLHKLFCSIWETEIFPDDWNTSILLPLPKKGDKSVCGNYRGISLIDTAAKIFTSLLLQRFSSERNIRTRINQGGFRPGVGCVDQIFTLRRILEHRYKFKQPTAACFIDFRAAFDSVDRGSLWNIMISDGVPPKIVRLLRSYYLFTKARVRMYGEETREFTQFTGVRQGCPMSPVLFNFVIDWIMSRATLGHEGVQIDQTTWISDLEYADDVVLLGTDFDSLQVILERVCHFAAAVGLKINADKTKAFSTCPSDAGKSLKLDGFSIETVDNFRYLGSIILPNGQAKDEIRNRIDCARNAFLQLKNALWNRMEVSLRRKIRVYQAAVRPVLLYGCECWPIRVEDVRRLEVFDHWCLRVILRSNWRDRLSNHTVRQRCYGIEPLSVCVKQRRLKWLGHVLRKSMDEMTRKTLAPIPCNTWRCKLGGQLKTWLATVKEDVDCFGLQSVYGVRRWKQDWVSICADLARDRTNWRAMVRDFCGAGSSCIRR